MEKNIRLFMIRSFSLALVLAASTSIVLAQEKKESVSKPASAEMQKMDYKIPERPEDISPLLTGEKIPMVMLPEATGNSFDLGKAIASKPTVLVVYRGGWCPYCTKQLSGLQEALPELEKMGYQLIAVSTDAAEGLTKSIAKEKLSYTLLSDADLSFSKQLGIAFRAPKGYWDMLPKTTGGKDTDMLLPVPSVFILDKSGTIHFEYINPDFKKRLSSEQLIGAAKNLAGHL